MTALLVHPEHILDPRHPIASITRAEHAAELALETEVGRVATRPTIVTYVDEQLREHLLERTAPFVLVLTPQSCVEGLDGAVLERAAGVFRVGPVGGDRSLPAPFEGASFAFTAGPPTTRDGEPLPSDDRGAWWVYPSSYLSLWERMVARRELPGWFGVVTDCDHPPPTWFEAKLADHGVELRIAYVPPNGEALRVALGGTSAARRENGSVDAIDLALAGIELELQSDLPRPTVDSIIGWDALLGAALAALRGSRPTPAASAPGGKPRVSTAPTINIVCFNPTYLFKDLVERFERIGCVHSELPMTDADALIWMRPQELAAFADRVRGNETTDVPASWLERFEAEAERYEGIDLGRIEATSVAIHHGTCFEPIVQFDPYRLAKKLATAGVVAGVCERDLCYGPAAAWANPSNFEFVPIGYDHELFTESVIRGDTRKGEPLKIGFVGRAYGTDKPSALAASSYAHPKGYRKGGDHLLHVLLRVKAMGVPFELQLVGNNWDGHVEQMKALGLPVRYYTRDANIDYSDYPSVFASFDALLVAARAEGGPVSAIEAMSVGVPVIGSDVGVIPYCAEVSEHCRTVHFDTRWHTFDDQAAAAALAELYRKRFTREDRMGIRRAIESHTTEHWVRTLRKLASGLITG